MESWNVIQDRGYCDLRVVCKKLSDSGIVELETIHNILLDNEYEYVMGIDASTTTTGINIMEIKQKETKYSLAIYKDEDETNARYKVRFKGLLYEILSRYKSIKYVEYEEPIMRHLNAYKVLLPLSTSFEELQVEKEPELDYIDFNFIGNKRWKKQLLGDDMPSSGTEKEKNAVKKKVLEIDKRFGDSTQDEMDAFGISYVKCMALNGEIYIERVKKRSAFLHDVVFVGAECLEDALLEITNNVDYPDDIKENGVGVANLGKSERLEQSIYNTMNGEDKLVIVEFLRKQHGNIVLKYSLADLKEYDKLFAVAWRKNRKKYIKRR